MGSLSELLGNELKAVVTAMTLVILQLVSESWQPQGRDIYRSTTGAMFLEEILLSTIE